MSDTDSKNKTSNNSRIINLTSADSELLVDEAIAEINFKAPLETGTAATTNCAQIQAKRENKSHAKLIGGDWTYDHAGGASERLWTTSVAHTLSTGDQVVFSSIGSGVPGYQTNKIYYVIAPVTTTTLTLSHTNGGLVIDETYNKNLVVWLKFNDEEKDTQGNTVTETGTLTYSNTAGEYKYGTHSAIFTSGDYLTIANPQALLHSALSITVWVYCNDSTQLASGMTIVEKGYNNEFELYIKTNGELIFMFGDNGSSRVQYQTSNFTISFNTWIHIAVTRETNTSIPKIYVNGTKEIIYESYAGTPDGTVTSNDIYVGKRINGTDNHQFVGYLDDLRIYNSVLTATEVYNIYNLDEDKFDSTGTWNAYQNIGGSWSYTQTSPTKTWTTEIAHGLSNNDEVVIKQKPTGSTTTYSIDTIYYVNTVPTTTTVTLKSTYGGSTIVDGTYSDISSNLKGWWKLNGNANDSSGNGYNGTNNGAINTVDRNNNQSGAYYFDGTDYLTNNTIVNSSMTSFFGRDAFTISLWINPGVSPSTTPRAAINVGGLIIFHWGHSGSGYWKAWMVKRGTSGQSGTATNNDGWGTAQYTNTFSLNSWFHIVGTFDGIYLKAYLNGQINTTTTLHGSGQLNAPNRDLYIGSNLTNSSFFKGSIDDVRIYNIALTANQVSDIYNETTWIVSKNVPRTQLSFNTASTGTVTEKAILNADGDLTITGNLDLLGNLSLSGNSVDTNYIANTPSAKISLGSNTGSPVNINISNNAVVSFDNIDYDTLDKFSTSTYKYTIPMTGKYLVTINFYINYSSGIYGKLAIVKTSSSTDTELLYSNTWGEGGHTMTGIFSLTLDDTIFVKNISGTAIDIGAGTTYTNMSIIMISYGKAYQDSIQLNSDVTTTSNNQIYLENTNHDTRGKNLTIKAGSTTAGTSNNIAGGSLILEGGKGKGTGAGGDIKLNIYENSTTGSSYNAQKTVMTVSDNSYLGVGTTTPTNQLEVVGNMRANYNSTKNISRNNLIGYWKFDGNVNDTSGNHYHGTVSGNNLNDSLICWWKMNGDAADSSGNNNHGTLVHDPPLTTDRLNNANSAYDFDGSNDYISIPSPSTDLSKNLTISMWFKRDNTSEGECLISKSYTREFELTIWSYLYLYNGTTAGGTNTYYYQGPAKSTFLANVWYHILVTREGSGTSWTAKFYVNGVFNTSSTGTAGGPGSNTPQIDSYPIFIGVRNTNGTANTTNCFDGSIYDVRIYNRVLTAEQVQNIYIDKTVVGPILAINRFGNINNAYNFEGTLGDKISFPNPTTNLNGEMSLSFWFNRSSTGDGGNYTLISKGGRHYEFDVSILSNNRFTYHNGTSEFGDNYYSLASSTDIDSNVWTHFALTRKPVTDYTSNLIGWWKFDGNTNDSSGNSNGTLGDGSTASTYPTPTTDRYGLSNQAYSFDGGDYIKVSDTVNGIKSVSLWINLSDNTNTGLLHFTSSIYLRNGSPASINAVGFSNPSIYLNGINQSITTIGTNNYTGDGVNAHFSANVWYHVVVTTNTAIDAGTNFQIGRYNSVYCNGSIDDVRIYNTVLTEQQIYDIYNDTVIKMYINGCIDTTSTYSTLTLTGKGYNTPSVTTNPITVGGGADRDTFKGLINEVSLYSTELTQNQVWDLYYTKADLRVNGMLLGSRNLNPIAHWKFDGNITDSVGGLTGVSKSNSGALYADTYTTGPTSTNNTNKALDFSGSSSTSGNYIDLSSHASALADFSEGFSFVGWVMWDSLNAGSRIFDLGQGSSNDNILLANNNTTTGLKFEIYSGSSNANSYFTTTSYITTGTWIHVGVTYNNETKKVIIYKNGVLSNSDTFDNSIANVARTSSFIGKSNWGDSYFNGKMSDLRIYKTTLTAEEVYYIYYYSGIGDGNQYNQPYTKGIKLVDSGDVGIGTLNPSSKLHVEGSIRNDTGVVSFTGAHDIERGNLNNFNSGDIGKIIRCKGTYKKDIEIFNAIPICELSDTDNDKKVYGVLSKTDNLLVNAIGEGCIWVCNKNGNLSNGDYITSSTLKGYGVKQILNEGILKNYTVAKITCDCDFSLTKIIKQKIKYNASGIDYDSNGNLQYIDDLDYDGNQQSIYKYQTRFLDSVGNLLQDENDYTTRLNNSENVYIACFVGCTYHCG